MERSTMLKLGKSTISMAILQTVSLPDGIFLEGKVFS
jgi:hypothetical protein